jgi:hypothetical protein
MMLIQQHMIPSSIQPQSSAQTRFMLAAALLALFALKEDKRFDRVSMREAKVCLVTM